MEGWMCGSGNDIWHGPDFLLNEDIILVTHNYRLGALGFISMVNKIIPGNNGLKDSALALKWTKDNIGYFGGDVNRITVFGNSAGAGTSHFQLLSPKTKGLIHGAILQSGTALAPWALSTKKRAKTNTKLMAQHFGCSTSSSKGMLSCLRKINATDIISSSSLLYKWSTEPAIPFKPVIEVESEHAFLTENPMDVIKSGKCAQVPIMSTVTTEEGILKAAYIFNNSELMHELIEDFDRIVPVLMLYDEFSDQGIISSKIKEFYLNNTNLSENHTMELINMVGDFWFAHPSQLISDIHTKYVQKPAYQLLYGYRSAKTFGDLFGSQKFNYGVSHCDELLNLFKMKMFDIYHKNKLDVKAVQTLTRLWANFARTGNPTPDEEFPKWEVTSPNISNVYYINNNVDFKTIHHPFMDRINFWEKITAYDKEVNQDL